MRKLLTAFFALGIAVMLLPSAWATMVTYSTDGCFGVSCTPVNTALISQGGAVLSFTGQINDTVSANPTTFGSLGDFSDVLSLGTGTFSAEPFTLEVIQSVPGPTGSGNLLATINGT